MLEIENEKHENLWFIVQQNSKLHIVSLLYLQQLFKSILVYQSKIISQSS
jgi:hypothetical protein